MYVEYDKIKNEQIETLRRNVSNLIGYDLIHNKAWEERDDLLDLNSDIVKELADIDKRINSIDKSYKLLNLSYHKFLSDKGTPTWQLEVIKELWTPGIGLDINKFKDIRWALLIHRRGGKSRLMNLLSLWLALKYPNISVVGGMENAQYFKDVHLPILVDYMPSLRLDLKETSKIFQDLQSEVDDYKSVMNLGSVGKGKMGKNLIYFPNNSTYGYVGIKTEPIRGRGKNLAMVWLDEVALIDAFADAVTAVSPTLNEAKGGLILVSTAYPGWYENYVRSQRDARNQGNQQSMVFNYGLYNSGIYDKDECGSIMNKFYTDKISVGTSHAKALLEVAQEGFNYFGLMEDERNIPLFYDFHYKPDDYIVDDIQILTHLKLNINEYKIFTITDYAGGAPNTNTSVLWCASNWTNRQLIIFDELNLKGSNGNPTNTVKQMYGLNFIHGELLSPIFNGLDSQASSAQVVFDDTHRLSYLDVYKEKGQVYDIQFEAINRKTKAKIKKEREATTVLNFQILDIRTHPLTGRSPASKIYISRKCQTLISNLISSKYKKNSKSTKTGAKTYMIDNEDIIDAFYYAVMQSEYGI